MGYKKLSNEQEKQLVQEYLNGETTQVLMQKYCFKTHKSIFDKVKKFYPNDYAQKIKEVKEKRKTYSYKMEKIQNEFDAYFLGLLLTDGYVNTCGRRNQVGIDLIDEDCISFLSTVIGKNYKRYSYEEENRQDRYRLILEDEDFVKNLERLGVVPRKSKIIKGPLLEEDEMKFIPYIIREIIDGDGTVSPTSYNGPQIKIVTMSKDFVDWLVDVLTNKMFLQDIHTRQNPETLLWTVETANILNIQKIIALCYNKPFGMNRKYEQLRKTFRDYNSCSIL